MKSFDDSNLKFHFERFGDEYVIVLDSQLVFCVGGKEHVIPVGFTSNGMSVPRCLWSLISPQFHPKTLAPSIIHDYLYEHYILCRREADRWYRDALIDNGYAEWKAWVVYFAITLFGKNHWCC